MTGRVASALALFLTLAAVLPAPAQACTCPHGGGRLLWPKDQARDVSIEPDIVVSLHPRFRTAGVHLTGPAGAGVELQERRREADNKDVSCAPDVVFLTPVVPLAPNTRYALAFEIDFDAGEGEGVETPSFTTGSEGNAAPEPTELSVQFDRLIQGPDCKSEATPSCPDLADPVIEETVREDAPPSWLRVKTQGTSPDNDRLLALPGSVAFVGLFGGRVAALTLESSEGCLSYERIDVRGRTIAQDQVCQARRCAVLGETSWSSGRTSCRSIWPLFEGFWEAAGEGSCAAPPLIDQDRDTGKLTVVPAEKDAGCSTGAAASRTSSGAWALLTLAALLARRRSST